jgi:hypothetical protein
MNKISKYAIVLFVAVFVATTGLGSGCRHRGTGLVGAACDADRSCTTGVCIGEKSTSGWAGGYCSGNCAASDCPQGGRCLLLADGFSYCVAECDSQEDCRSGYVCSTGVSACLPDCRQGWSCGGKLTCDPATGTCTLPAPFAGNTPLGAACTINLECASGLCIPERSGTGGFAWSGGTCSLECANASCPGGAVCVALEDGRAYCVPSCAGTTGCRAGYVCSAAVGACLPDCRLGWSCGARLVCDTATGACTPPPGTTPLGSPCTLNLDCASGLCIPEQSGTGSVAWSGGMCSQECTTTACPTGASCVAMKDGSAYCAPACAGTVDCRAGYVCSAGVGACLPDCRLGWSCGDTLVCDAATGGCTLAAPDAGTAPLGSTCTVNLECASGLCIPERGSTGTLAWTDGTCSQACSAAACPAGATCVPMEDGSAYCVSSCASSADCRTGYVCDIEVFGCLPDCRLGWSCGTRLVCDAASGSCVVPALSDAGADGGRTDGGRTDGGQGDTAGRSGDDVRGPGDTGGFGPGGGDAGRGGGGPGGMW